MSEEDFETGTSWNVSGDWRRCMRICSVIPDSEIEFLGNCSIIMERWKVGIVVGTRICYKAGEVDKMVCMGTKDVDKAFS